MTVIGPATDWELVRKLFREYQTGVDAAVCFASFDAELASLPAPYFAVLIAQVDERPAGCVALKDLGDGTAEVKRLYVRPYYRGKGLGEQLVRASLAAAAGYARVRLDTLPQMSAAIALYGRMGFTRIERYNDNPDPGALFFEILLSD